MQAGVQRVGEPWRQQGREAGERRAARGTGASAGALARATTRWVRKAASCPGSDEFGNLRRWIDSERCVSNGRRRCVAGGSIASAACQMGVGVVWRASLVRQAGDRPFGRVAANARRELSTHRSGGGRRGGRIAVVVVVVLLRVLGVSCQRIGAAAFVLLQMLGVRCRHISAGGGVCLGWRLCDRPCRGRWCEGHCGDPLRQ